MRFFQSKKSPDDRPALAHAGRPSKSPYDTENFRSEIISYLQDLRDSRLVLSPSEEASFSSEYRALYQSIVTPQGETDSWDDLVEGWQKVRAFDSQWRRNESIFVEGRFFEYQQILFDFARLFRHMEKVRSSTLEVIGSAINGGEQVETTKLKEFEQMLSREGREIRHTRNAVDDRIQAIRNILLEERVVPELDEQTGLLTRRSFEAAIARYINVSACTGESLTLIQFEGLKDDIQTLANAVDQTFKRQTDSKGRIDERTVGALILNVTQSNATMLSKRVVEFVKSADTGPPEFRISVARFDDTPEMLLSR